MEKLPRKISVAIFTTFVLVITLDPTGVILRVKELLFAFLMFLSLISINQNEKIPKSVLFVIGVCLSLPVWGILVAILKDNFDDPIYAFGHLKSFLFILIFFFLIKLDFETILKVLFISGTIIALCTTIIFIIAQLNADLFLALYHDESSDDIIIFSNRSYYGFRLLGIYFRTGPYMFFSYIYTLYFLKPSKGRNILMLLNLFALLIAGSRTPTLMAVLITIVYFNDKIKNNHIFRYLLISACVFALVLVTYKLASDKDEYSNAIKYADFDSYITILFEGSNPIVGAGLGSEFFSDGRGTYVSSSEQTYMDIFRIYGFILGAVLIVLVYYPVLSFITSKYRHIKKYQRFILAYVLYMILAGTNPLLVSSTGMLIWAIGLTFVYKMRAKQLEV